MPKSLLLILLSILFGFCSAYQANLAKIEVQVAMKKVSEMLSQSLQTISSKLPLFTSCFAQECAEDRLQSEEYRSKERRHRDNQLYIDWLQRRATRINEELSMTRFGMEETKTRIYRLLSSNGNEILSDEKEHSLHQLLSALDELREEQIRENDKQGQLLQHMNLTCANLTKLNEVLQFKLKESKKMEQELNNNLISLSQEFSLETSNREMKLTELGDLVADLEIRLNDETKKVKSLTDTVRSAEKQATEMKLQMDTMNTLTRKQMEQLRVILDEISADCISEKVCDAKKIIDEVEALVFLSAVTYLSVARGLRVCRSESQLLLT